MCKLYIDSPGIDSCQRTKKKTQPSLLMTNFCLFNTYLISDSLFV